MDNRRKKSALLRNLRRQGMNTAIILLAVILVFSCLNLLIRDKESSASENRKLAQRPAISLSALKDGSYFKGWESYIADQFTGRDSWIAVNRHYSDLIGQQESGGVYFGSDRYLLEAPAVPDRVALNRNLTAINDFAARHSDLNLTMTVVPNAANVLSDKLPNNAPVHNQKRDLELVEAQLKGIPFVSLQSVMEQHKDEYIYYHTDHHWTSLGAKYAFDTLAGPMKLTNLVSGYDIYPVSDSFEGTLASRSGSHKVTDVIEVYVPKGNPQYYITREGEAEKFVSVYDSKKLQDKDQYAMFLGGNFPRLDIVTTAESGRTLLLFKDSYANCFVQFLTPYFDRIILLDPRYYYGSADDVISREKVTDVLFLYNANTFLKDTVLADTLEP